MELAEVVRLVGYVACAEGDTREQLAKTLTDVRRIKAWCDAQEMRVARALEACTSFPEGELADAGRTGLLAAANVMQRAETGRLAPAFESALEAGSVTGAHLDVLGRALRQEGPAVRSHVLGRVDELAAAAQREDVDEFRKTLRRAVRAARSDDGMARLDQQRRDTRLRTWTDRETGMWHLAGTFDPVTGVRLSQRLDAALAELYALDTPSTCPADPIEKQHHLRALALVGLIGSVTGGVRTNSAGGLMADLTAVIDLTDASGPRVDWGIPVEVPTDVLTELLESADVDVHAVVVRNGVVLHAPGELRLGRSTRLANRAQRRVLRALYPTCAIPGCEVGFRHSKIHHVVWWRHGGLTDLDNLLPVCHYHHDRVHEHGWVLSLSSDRRLRVERPDGTTMDTGPPRRGG